MVSRVAFGGESESVRIPGLGAVRDLPRTAALGYPPVGCRGWTRSVTPHAGRQVYIGPHASASSGPLPVSPQYSPEHNLDVAALLIRGAILTSWPAPNRQEGLRPGTQGTPEPLGRCPLGNFALAGACGNRTHQPGVQPGELVLKTSGATRPHPPPRRSRRESSEAHHKCHGRLGKSHADQPHPTPRLRRLPHARRPPRRRDPAAPTWPGRLGVRGPGASVSVRRDAADAAESESPSRGGAATVEALAAAGVGSGKRHRLHPRCAPRPVERLLRRP